MMHWLTRYNPNDGEPYGTICDCGIGADHDGDGEPDVRREEDGPVSRFTAPEDGLYVLDPEAEGGYRKTDPSELGTVDTQPHTERAVRFDTEPLESV